MNPTLSRSQAIKLGLVVFGLMVLAGMGLIALSSKHGFWVDRVELTVGFPEVNDIHPGTPVRLRGLEVGQVLALSYPEWDGPDAQVEVRLQVQSQYAERLYADATAQIQSTGLLGSKVLALSPGHPQSGPLVGGRLQPGKLDPLGDATAKLNDVADETKHLLHSLRSGQGTMGKLLTDDELYHNLKGLADDSRAVLQRTKGTVEKMEGQVGNVERFVQDGRETLRSTRSTVEGVNQSWLGRRLIEDATALLVRPRHRREAVTYNTLDLFEPQSAILTNAGQHHLAEVGRWLQAGHPKETDVVIVALCDPEDRMQTGASALELTRKQSEAAVEFLKSQGAHKISWISKRRLTSLGLGQGPSPVVESKPLPASYLQVLLFTPQ